MNAIGRIHASALRQALLALALLGVGFAPAAHAKSAKKIDAQVNSTLKKFRSTVKGASSLLKQAKGVLVFPNVIKAGIGIGGEYGEGALRIHGKTVAYYSIASASIGFQLGAQKKDIIMVFMQQAPLTKFRDSSGWKVGVDGSVALINVGTGGDLDTMKINQPIVGFIIGQEGLMYNLTLEGSKFSKIKR
ncbi:MAG: YSC84-related protein [Gammaproteobacteria bacterium]